MGGRSLGCVSCKARRVKCDELQPTCRRCQKAGIICKGYSSRYVFVDEKSRVENSLARSQAQEEQLLGFQKSSRALYHKNHIPARAPLLVAEIPVTGFKSTIVLSYLFSRMYEDRDSSSMSQRLDSRAVWMQQLSDTSSAALHALATFVFAKAHESSELTREARITYGKALSDLQVGIQTPSKCGKFETLASATALCMYEGFESRSGQGWFHHADGMARLMEARGPSRYQNTAEKSFFLEQRVLLVSKAIVCGHETFLSRIEWKTVAWENEASAKEPADFLVDIYCDVATHVSATGALSKSLDYFSDVIRVKERIIASVKQLDTWWGEWYGANPAICQEGETNDTSSTSGGSGDDFLHPTLNFSSLAVAYTVATHNAIRILLLQLLQRTTEIDSIFGLELNSMDSAQKILHREPDQRYKPLLGITSNIENLAIEIIKVLSFCTSRSKHFTFSFLAFLVIDVAYYSLDPGSKPARWLRLMTEGHVDQTSSNYSASSVAVRILPSCQLLKSGDRLTPRPAARS